MRRFSSCGMPRAGARSRSPEGHRADRGSSRRCGGSVQLKSRSSGRQARPTASVSDDRHDACVYAERRFRFSGWRQRRRRAACAGSRAGRRRQGFRCRFSADHPDGVAMLRLARSDGTGTIVLKARGALALPSLPLAPPLTVQLQPRQGGAGRDLQRAGHTSTGSRRGPIECAAGQRDPSSRAWGARVRRDTMFYHCRADDLAEPERQRR